MSIVKNHILMNAEGVVDVILVAVQSEDYISFLKLDMAALANVHFGA